MGNTLIAIGAIILIIGLLFKFTGGSIPLMPGDILIKKDNFTFYFPIVSSILISIILTVIFSLFRK